MTIMGWPANATAVETRTTGLMAGDASRKVKAAAGCTPLPTRDRATGTDAHSQPGRTAPDSPAAKTAPEGSRGTMRCSRSGGTKAAMLPETTTPRAKNGRACTKIATQTVNQVLSRAGAETPSGRSTVTTRTRPTPTTGITATRASARRSSWGESLARILDGTPTCSHAPGR